MMSLPSAGEMRFNSLPPEFIFRGDLKSSDMFKMSLFKQNGQWKLSESIYILTDKCLLDPFMVVKLR